MVRCGGWAFGRAVQRRSFRRLLINRMGRVICHLVRIRILCHARSPADALGQLTRAL